MQEVEPAPGAARPLNRLKGESRRLVGIRDSLVRIAPLDSTVLLTGETGTGKGVAARGIHDRSPRSGRPFVHVDCAALSPSLIESELFGHEKGAFTNAAVQRAGRFEWARDGTVFLDEIGDLEPALQTKLLRVLDDRAYERIGGTQTLSMRARVIAATSRDLRKGVREGRFRADLYFRLGVFHFRMPALRERVEDIPEIARDGLERICRRLSLDPPVMSDDFIAGLSSYPWPGNVRELLNVLERLAVARSGQRLEAEDAREFLDTELVEGSEMTEAPPSTEAAREWRLADLRRDVDAADRQEIIRALGESRGCVAAAARRLQLPRSTLRHRMRKLGLAEV